LPAASPCTRCFRGRWINQSAIRGALSARSLAGTKFFFSQREYCWELDWIIGKYIVLILCRIHIKCVVHFVISRSFLGSTVVSWV
jgi:hypothetical protein